ncbi:MAG: tetratricopeptide repeat protein [Desulfobulbaceae bacterium]|nr:tetratricopeptide repeat protein [Desulfobulbaceae bacterium]
MEKNSPILNTILQVTLLLSAIFLLYGCGGVTTTPRSPAIHHPQPAVSEKKIQPTTEIPQVTSPANPFGGAAASLYRKAKTHLTQENFSQAELAMERALRIEPKNGYYWHTLALIKYRKKQYSQAVQLCLKSNSLAGANRTLIQQNEALIKRAQR